MLYNFFKNLFGKKSENEVKEKKKNFKFEVAGTLLGGRQANILKYFSKKIENKELILFENLKDYEIISKYPNGLIKFEKEPENEYDKNAIRVMIKGMGTVGYVPKNINVSFAKILENEEIKEVTATICGGEYKLWNGKKLKRERDNYSITITISY